MDEFSIQELIHLCCIQGPLLAAGFFFLQTVLVYLIALSLARSSASLMGLGK